MKNFTTENQKENNVTRTTTQTIKHFIYSNVEITICGWFNDSTNCKVWKKQGNKASIVAEGLNIEQAIELGNKLIIS